MNSRVMKLNEYDGPFKDACKKYKIVPVLSILGGLIMLYLASLDVSKDLTRIIIFYVEAGQSLDGQQVYEALLSKIQIQLIGVVFFTFALPVLIQILSDIIQKILNYPKDISSKRSYCSYLKSLNMKELQSMMVEIRAALDESNFEESYTKTDLQKSYQCVQQEYLEKSTSEHLEGRGSGH